MMIHSGESLGILGESFQFCEDGRNVRGRSIVGERMPELGNCAEVSSVVETAGTGRQGTGDT